MIHVYDTLNIFIAFIYALNTVYCFHYVLNTFIAFIML